MNSSTVRKNYKKKKKKEKWRGKMPTCQQQGKIQAAMLLKCEIVVGNRLSPNFESRKCHATLSLGRKKQNGESLIYFLVHTSKNKNGMKYQIKGNVIQVHNRFVNDGKCTISLKEPPHDLILSKAVVKELKKFLHIIKLAFKGEDTSSILDFTNILQPRNCDLEKPKTVLKIYSKTNYPLRTSFPCTLECLVINGCMLQKFDVRILKLTNLKELDLKHNCLTSLYNSTDGLINLTCIYLPNNYFEQVPLCLLKGETCLRIQLLDLSDNKIKFLSNKLTNLKQVSTLKFDRNNIQFLPSNIGLLKTLKHLHLTGNQIQLIPWSFSALQLNTLDLSCNQFHEENDHHFSDNLDDLPSLFETCARYVIKNRVINCDLPRIIQQQLDNAKYCPCGNPCVSNFIRYVRPYDIGQISHTVSYDMIFGRRAIVKMIGYLCSKKCYNKWLANPNTLFTN